MSLLRRSLGTLRNFRPRAEGPKESYFAQGTRTDRNGFLFSETPLPAGESRKWESWELGWCVSAGPLPAPLLRLERPFKAAAPAWEPCREHAPRAVTR